MNIQTFTFENSLITVMPERLGGKLLPLLSSESKRFDFFTREEAYRLVENCRVPEAKSDPTDFRSWWNFPQDPLRYFSGDNCGATGDCIICREGDKIFCISVSVRGRVRIREGGFAYGGGKVFIKLKDQNPTV